MTIECYYQHCPHHGANEDPPDEGPFCFQSECIATETELKLHAIIREYELLEMVRKYEERT
jgi:hypothetical protein